MQPTTLRGIFPERKIPHRKNFIRDNVKKIRQIQNKIKNGEETIMEVIHDHQIPKAKGNLQLSHAASQYKITDSAQNQKRINTHTKPPVEKLDLRTKPRNTHVDNTQQKVKRTEYKEEKPTHRATQTELGEDIESIYSTGVIKYPSPSILVTVSRNKKSAHKTNELGHGDCSPKKDTSRLKNESSENRVDYVKQNKAMIKCKVRKDLPVESNLQAPANYKRGVVPKYIKNKKDLLVEEAGDIECPPGHVLLPEEERKETLRVLTESYTDKIKEMNAMPVRSDTLRMQKRKIELEQDLKKIDEGMKVFQRPKVFVKINV